MKEKDALIERVCRTIKEYGGRRIVLYGTGNVTRWVIEALKENSECVVNKIMDFNYSEESFEGFPVIRKDQISMLLENDLIIIMNRNPVIAQFIYNRIYRFLPEGSMAVSIDGDIFEKPGDEGDADNSISDQTFDEIKKKIDDADVVSFDIFDTLLVRCVEKPIDVFLLMEKKINNEYGISGFSELRKETEIKANKVYSSPSLKEIYEEFLDVLGRRDDATVQALVQEEIATECELLLPREKNIELLKYCAKTHKTVYLISDTYYNAETFIRFFDVCGVDILSILETSHMLLSCELRKNKESGEIWDYYARIVGDSGCLHIGDNLIADIKNSKDVGIDSIYTASPYELRREKSPSVFYEMKSALTSLQVGLFDAQVFNSPFQKEREIDTHFDYGYYILGPVIFNYLYWVLRESVVAGMESRQVYFFSRDGYFLVRLFNEMAEVLNKQIRGEYLYTSRAFLKYIFYTQGKGEKAGFIGSLKDYLKYRFNYDAQNADLADKYVDADDDTDTVLAPYIDDILKRQEESRKKYDEYLKKIGINRGDKDVIVVDPTYNGTCQYYLSKHADISTKGFYCVANLSDDNRFISDRCRLHALYQKPDDKKATDSIINKYTLVFESSIMVSPEGSMLDITEDGFIFTPTGKTQELFEDKEETYSGIKKYVEEMCDMILRFDLGNQEPDSIFPQAVFAMFMEGSFKVSDKIKCSLYADDYYNQVTDYSVVW